MEGCVVRSFHRCSVYISSFIIRVPTLLINITTTFTLIMATNAATPIIGDIWYRVGMCVTLTALSIIYGLLAGLTLALCNLQISWLEMKCTTGTAKQRRQSMAVMGLVNYQTWMLCKLSCRSPFLLIGHLLTIHGRLYDYLRRLCRWLHHLHRSRFI